jgi:N-acetylglutamate synthase-like GNAT family acetyltransferase
MIRRARVEDAGELRALVEELGYAGLDPAAFAAGLARVLEAEGQSVWVAETEGRVVGFVSVSCRPQLRLGAAVATIDEIVVAEAARGSGVGTELLEQARCEAARGGAVRLELHTQRARTSYARGFYAKNGFVEIDSAVMRSETRQ